jgi:hypothetical protein
MRKSATIEGFMQKLSLRLFLIGSLLCIPGLATAGTLAVDDVVAGFDTTATLTGAPQLLFLLCANFGD